MTTLFDIPHEDVIYKHIFCYLTFNDLENLHDADASLQSLVTLYIEQYCKIFNFNEFDSQLSLPAFLIDNIILSYNCAGSRYLVRHPQHILTGNLSTIEM